MKNLIVITTLCLSMPTMAADFCVKYQKDIQKEEQKLVQQSKRRVGNLLPTRLDFNFQAAYRMQIMIKNTVFSNY